MIKVTKFQSKSGKRHQRIYTLQKNGNYKSNGPQGSEFSQAYFNSLNPVLEVLDDNRNITFKVGDNTSQSGKIVSMKLTENRQDVQITGDSKVPGMKFVLVSNALKIGGKLAAEAAPAKPEFDLNAAKASIMRNIDIPEDLYRDELNKCCGINEVGSFPDDNEIENCLEEAIDGFEEGLPENLTAANKAKLKTKAFKLELVRDYLEKSDIDFDESFIATVHNEGQSLVLSAFKEIARDNGNMKFIETTSNSSGNTLTIIVNTHE